MSFPSPPVPPPSTEGFFVFFFFLSFLSRLFSPALPPLPSLALLSVSPPAVNLGRRTRRNVWRKPGTKPPEEGKNGSECGAFQVESHVLRQAEHQVHVLYRLTRSTFDQVVDHRSDQQFVPVFVQA